MNYSNLIIQYIPDYALLPDEVRVAFEATEHGDELIQTLLHLNENLERTESSRFFNLCYSALFETPTLSDDQPIKSTEIYLHQFMGYHAIHHCMGYQVINDLVHKTKVNHLLRQWTLTHIDRLHLDLLKTAYKKHLGTIQDNHFNSVLAKTLVQHSASLDEWAKIYSESLQKHIINNISLINGLEPFPHPPTFSKENLGNSLSRLFSYVQESMADQTLLKSCVDAVNKAADAHAFLQATGFATQNETSWLAGFDIVNYFRMAGHVAESKTIFFKFLQPFTPLFIEYSNINREENMAKQIIRTLMPFLIISLAVTLVAAFLSSIVIPEIAFIFILLPTLYLGLIAASSYVVAKNRSYYALSQFWYGGQFEIPEYQVSELMEMSFGLEKAIKIRHFYVDEISACFKKETAYQAPGRLSHSEMVSRKENTLRRNALLLEWYDIHSNLHLSKEAAVEIALNRLQLDGRKAYDTMQTMLESELKTTIQSLSDDIANEIKTAVERGGIRPLMTATQQPRFFTRPVCFEHRETVERLLAISAEIKTNPIHS